MALISPPAGWATGGATTPSYTKIPDGTLTQSLGAAQPNPFTPVASPTQSYGATSLFANTPGYQAPTAAQLNPGSLTVPQNPGPASPTFSATSPSGGDLNSAFTSFVNSNPQYASGGQSAIDAFGQQYPQYAGVISWDPTRQVYESQGGYFTNLPGNAQNGWSLTATQPETGGTAANPFSDPATAPWAALVQQLTGQLQQPLDTTYQQGLLNYANQYFQQLQGPAYTPQQLQLYNTTAINPINQSRDSQDQAIIQQYAARGIPASSGIVQSAIDANHQQAQGLTTQAQSQIGLQAIGTQQQNAAQALNVGQTLAGILPATQQANETRALTGVNLLSQIPALADTRLAAANTTLSGSNPSSAASLIGPLVTAMQNGQINSQQFWQTLGQLLGGL